MKRTSTVSSAQESSAMATTKSVAGVKVWPVTHGHLYWLRSIRKNKILSGKSEDDMALAEICYAFTHDSLKLLKIPSATATKGIKDLLMGSQPARLDALFTYGAEQIGVYLKTLTSPKKSTAQASRKPAARVRKR